MMKIFIPGGAGYIGSVLSRKLLDKGYFVTVFDNFTYNQAPFNDLVKNERFNVIKGDILNYSLIDSHLSKFDVIIPLAAIVGAPACDKNPTLSKLINQDANINIVNKTSKNQLVLYPNTNSGYGISDKNDFCTEETPLNPISLYGTTKCKVEDFCMQKGNAICFRLATVFGPSDRMRIDLLVNDFVYRALKDKYLVLFEENFRRNYIHVDDVADSFLFAIENEEMNNNIFNIGLSSANLTKKQLAEKISNHVKDLYIQSSDFNKDPDKRDYFVSNEKIEKFGWKAKIDLDIGITQLIKLYSYLKVKNFNNL